MRVLLLTGAPGVGKSTLAEEMFDQLAARGVRHAVIDVDALGLSFPFPPDDPYNDRVILENLKSVVGNYVSRSIDRLILVRLVETPADVRRLTAAVPGAVVTVCLLQAPAAVVEQRVRRREVGSSAESLVARGRELSQRDPVPGLAGLVVDTAGLPLPALARSVLEAAGWLEPAPGGTA